MSVRVVNATSVGQNLSNFQVEVSYTAHTSGISIKCAVPLFSVTERFGVNSKINRILRILPSNFP